MRLAVIGGGAAGLMCAAAINEKNPQAEVFLIEKNDSLGKKVIISGGGRCNVTTGIQDIRIVLKKYPRGSKFLSSALYNFPPLEVQRWFEDHNVPLKCENDQRVFPVSNQGRDVVEAFNKVFTVSKTTVLLNHNVKAINIKNNNFVIDFRNNPSITVDKVVLSMGGQAYRQTGSTGDGYSLAENLGHKITKLAPSLSSLSTKEAWPGSLSGLSFSQAALSVQGSNKYEFSGPFIFTHWGISGPAVFALSSLIAFEAFSDKEPLNILVDLVPDLSVDQVIVKIKSFMETNPKKLFKYSLHQIIALSLADVAVKQSGISDKKSNSQISKKELNTAAKLLKHLPLTIVGRHKGDEFVTAGGVDLVEVNSSTMESKICPGLYFAGEILNIDGYTGGFNLQASWSTGRLAGEQSCIVK